MDTGYRSSKGVLITCDVPTKQFILSLDTRLADVPTKQFILSLDTRLACVVSDLDATHVFVKKDSIKEIQRELDLLHEKNVYVRPRS
eukprot:g14633.t2